MTDDARSPQEPAVPPAVLPAAMPGRRRLLTVVALTGAAALTGCSATGPQPAAGPSSLTPTPDVTHNRPPHGRAPQHRPEGTSGPGARAGQGDGSGTSAPAQEPAADPTRTATTEPSHSPTHQPTTHPTHQPTSTASPSSSQPDGMGALVATADVPVGGGVVVHPAGVVITQPTSGEFHGFDGRCTHAGCLIGSVAAGLIQCPCHGSRFAIVDGSVVHGPATKPLPPFAVRVVGGYIYPA